MQPYEYTTHIYAHLCSVIIHNRYTIAALYHRVHCCVRWVRATRREVRLKQVGNY